MTQGRVRRATTAAAVTGAAALLLAAGASSARAQLTTITGSGSTTGINSGFGNAQGGVIGAGATLSVAQASPGSSLINFTLAKGPGDLNDVAVFYIATANTAATGFSTTATFDDIADGGRRAVSGFDGTNRSTLNFATGFTADFAISVENGFAGIFALSGTGSHTFVTSANLSTTGGTGATAQNYLFELNLTNIGLAAGQSFDFVGTYLNSGNAFRSNEFIGVAPGSFNSGNIGQAPATLGTNDFVRFNSVAAAAVPEPGALALLAAGAVSAALLVRRRRIAK
jgi:hypothetical protein